jgi:DNA-binding phage protein
MVSTSFKIAVKLADRPAWKIAREAGISATDLYKFCSGATIARPGNPKVLKVGEILGLTPEQCFEDFSDE